MDNFKAYRAGDVLQPLEDNGVLVVFLPANTTDRFQPLNLSINKDAKDFLFFQVQALICKESFQKNEPENGVVPVEMPAGVMKELGAKWLVAFYDYICIHPELVVNEFKYAGIVLAIENGAVGPPQHSGTFWDDDQVEDPFLDIHYDSVFYQLYLGN